MLEVYSFNDAMSENQFLDDVHLMNLEETVLSCYNVAKQVDAKDKVDIGRLILLMWRRLVKVHDEWKRLSGSIDDSLCITLMRDEWRPRSATDGFSRQVVEAEDIIQLLTSLIEVWGKVMVELYVGHVPIMFYVVSAFHFVFEVPIFEDKIHRLMENVRSLLVYHSIPVRFLNLLLSVCKTAEVTVQEAFAMGRIPRMYEVIPLTDVECPIQVPAFCILKYGDRPEDFDILGMRKDGVNYLTIVPGNILYRGVASMASFVQSRVRQTAFVKQSEEVKLDRHLVKFRHRQRKAHLYREVEFEKIRTRERRAGPSTRVAHEERTLDRSVHSLHNFLLEHGYTPANIARAPQALVKSALSQYIDGYGLHNLHKLIRQNDVSQRLFSRDIVPQRINCSPEPGKDKRMIVYKAWKECLPNHGTVVVPTRYRKQMQPVTKKAEKHLFDDLFSSDKKEEKKVKKEGGFLSDQVTGAAKAALSDPEVKALAKQFAKDAASGVLEEIKSSANSFLDYCRTLIRTYIKPIVGVVVGVVVFISLVVLIRMCFKTAVSVAFLRVLQQAQTFFVPDENPEVLFTQYVKQGIFDSLDSKFKYVREALHETSRTTISMKNVKEFIADSVNFAKKAIDVVCEWNTGVPYFEDSKKGLQYVRDMESLITIAATWVPGGVQDDAGKAREFLRAYQNLQAYSLKLSKAKESASTVTRIDVALKNAFPVYQAIFSTFGSADNRVEPVWVNLFGKPKQGKTVLLNTLPPAVYGMMNMRTWSSANLYSKNPSEEFWSKYENQYVTIYDDLFQSRDVTQRNRVASEFIRLVNTAPCPLDMPDVVSKGCTNFTSRFILSSTNILSEEGYTDLGLVSTEAFFRRMTLSIKVELKSGVDSNRAVTVLAPDSPEWDNYNLTLIRRGSDILNPPVMLTRDSLLLEIQKAMEAKYAAHKSSINNAAQWSDFKPGKQTSRKEVNSSLVHEVDNSKLSRLDKFDFDPQNREYVEQDSDNPFSNTWRHQGLFDSFLWKKVKAGAQSYLCASHPMKPCVCKNHSSPTVCEALNVVAFRGGKLSCVPSAYNLIPWSAYTVTSQHNIFSLCHNYGNREVAWSVGQDSKSGLKTFNFVVRASEFVDKALQVSEELQKKMTENIHLFGSFFTTTGLCHQSFSSVFSEEERKIISAHYFGTTSFGRTVEEVMKEPSNHNLHLYRQLFLMQNPSISKEDFDSSLSYYYHSHASALQTITSWNTWATARFVLGMLLTATTAFSLMFGIIYAVMGFDGKWMKESLDGDKHTKKTHVRTLKKGALKPAKWSQQSSDVAAEDLSWKIVSQSLFWIEVSNGDQVSRGFGLFVDANTFITNQHIWDCRGTTKQAMPEKVSLYQGETEIALSVVDCKQFPNRDLVVVFTNGGFSKPDLRKHIPSVKGCPSSYQNLALVTISQKGLVESHMGRSATQQTVALQVEESVYAPGMFECVGITSYSGQCGSPYIAHGTRIDKKLMGLHSAGLRNNTLVSPFYLEDFDLPERPKDEVWERQALYMKRASLSRPFSSYSLMDYRLTAPIESFGDGLKPAYRIEGLSFSSPQQTQLIPTLVNTGVKGPKPLAAPWPVEEVPAKLKCGIVEGVVLNPNKIAYRHYCKKKVPKPPRELDDMDLYKGIFTEDVVSRKATYRLATVEEAVFGWSEMAMPSIELSTSSAFPFVGKGFQRRQLINFDTRFIHLDVLNEVEYIIRKATKGKVVPHFTLHCLKDETRSRDRVLKYQTRAFQIGALAHLIVSRMAWMWLMAVVEHGLTGDIAVGINPYSSDWDFLFNRLNKFPCAKDTDTQAWDHNYIVSIVDPFIRAFCFFLDQDVESLGVKLMWSTFRSSVEPFVVIGSNVYRCLMMASGTLVTSFCNSIANSVKGRLIFKVLAKIHAPELALQFDAVAAQTVFGDDNVITFLKVIASWYNGKTMAEQALKLFGHTHTGTDKGLDDVEYKKLTDCEYLKRSFLKSTSGKVFAPLNVLSIRNMVQWIREPKECSVSQQFEINVNVAMFEISLHGYDAYIKMQSQLNAFNFAYHNVPHCISYPDQIRIHMIHKM